MKAILMSIKPKWVAKILNGKKTIEIRKKFPKDYVGWVYIYVAHGRHLLDLRKQDTKDNYRLTTQSKSNNVRWSYPPLLNGKVIARFWCDKVGEIEYKGFGGFAINMPSHIYNSFVDKFYSLGDLLRASCLPYDEFHNYLKSKTGYAIHITKLEIFNKPKEIKEFMKTIDNFDGLDCWRCSKRHNCSFNRDKKCEKLKLTRAPQSWCYVEV